MDSNNNLKKLRNKIAAIDKQILEQLSKRMALSLKIELAKRTTNTKIFIPDLEQKKIISLQKLSKEKLDPDFVEKIYKKVFVESRKLQINQRKNISK
jgi:chorismate mutase